MMKPIRSAHYRNQKRVDREAREALDRERDVSTRLRANYSNASRDNAQLRNDLAAALGGEFKIAEGIEVATIPDQCVISFRDSIDSDMNQLMREASVTVDPNLLPLKEGEAITEALFNSYRNNITIAWRSCAWKMVSVQDRNSIARASGVTDFGMRFPRIQFDLRAIVTRPSRQYASNERII